MRIAKRGMLALASAGLLCCSSSTSKGTLGFTVAESLLVLKPSDPTFGYALLSSGTGNCAAVQAGIAPGQVGSMNYLFVIFSSLDVNGNLGPLTAGSYSVLDPNGTNSPNLPALVALSSVIASDNMCNYSGANATSGTAVLEPFDSTDGGSSTLNYTAIYNGAQLTGTSQLTTCLLSATVASADAGTCIPCVAGADGGACVIQ